ncbi:putative membrane protein [Candidatus Methanomarinus sp.]|nr:putative membrane protein [ANME-2 cluster archaeon]
MRLMKSLGNKKCILILFGSVFLTDVAILLNIPYLRSLLGFIFLTFLPGFLILGILKLDKIGLIEKFVLSIGLSVSFSMFFGLLLNNSSLALGYKSPLSTVPLLISFNIAAIALIFVTDRLNKNNIFSLPDFNLSTSEKSFLIVPILFPALSIFGTDFMNTTNNNIISIFLLFVIPIYVIFICFFNKKFPVRIYPLIIFLISISLILMEALRSNHVLGVDAHSEYYLFQMTLNNMYWSVFGHSALNACLSISLLPTIYQSLLNVDPECFFNVFYVFLFSFVPLVVFVISKKYVGNSYGFLASIFYIFQTRFIFATGGARTNVAIFFFALAMMILFNNKIDPLKKKILFIVFMASCVVSHYSTTYIFFFIMLGTFVMMEMLSKKFTFKRMISSKMVILFFSMIFFWYSQVTETAFNIGVSFIEKTLKNLHEFFILESRGTGETLLGQGIMEKGIPHKIEFVFTWLAFAFIGIGILTLIRRYKEMSFPELIFKKSEFLKEKFEVTYFTIALACSGLLVVMISLPYLAVGYALDRLYTVAITILSVFFVIGGITLSQNLFLKNGSLSEKQNGGGTALQVRAYLIILLVLIPYFFCVTGVTYQMLGYPRQITLNSKGEQYDELYTHDQESCAAKWLGGYAKKRQTICADFEGRRLESQGRISISLINYYWLPNPESVDGYIYLRYQNVVSGKFLGYRNEVYNMTDFQDVFTEKNGIYDSGCSKIYY